MSSVGATPIYQSTNLPIYQSTNLPIYQSKFRKIILSRNQMFTV
ncbi:hypothetical protein [Chryseobacterium schmidteae]|nr:hypothetical protein [Chryseobacterium schmidteae]